MLRLGVTNWLTPDKNLIKNEGVHPDSLVGQDAAVPMVDSYALEGAESLNEVLGAGDRQFNLALLQLRLLPQTAE